MIKSILTYWEMTQVVKETVNTKDVEKLLLKHFSSDFKYNIYETSKDEVLQIYNDEYCYTIIGGSSADKWEWKGNFTFAKLKNLFKKDDPVLAKGLMHQDYYKSAVEVMSHSEFIERDKVILTCHSRGGGVGKCISYERGWLCIAFGSPKVFLKRVEVNVINVLNRWDIVGWVVPFFKRCGKTVWYNFKINFHTGYGKHIKKGDTID